MIHSKVPHRTALTVVFAIIIFFVLVITMFIVSGFILLFANSGILDQLNLPNVLVPILTTAISSIIVGTIVGAFFSRLPLNPIAKLINGMNELAKGDYHTRIDMGSFPLGKEVSNSFNTLANELDNTEMLRTDFINNFSHEFKTPIVSIRGFAKLLKKGCISDEQKTEYLDIIIDESTRLADMATNVLNLTKVENQNILTSVSEFNLSEQIRNSILLLEKKWASKSISIVADFDEFNIKANEELLKQVWINLLDNAIKFSSKNGEINVSIARKGEYLSVLIENYGSSIDDNDKERIFNKFYQGDTSHASEGTGIGLAIVKKIIELHKGTIDVKSTDEKTVFAVDLLCVL